MTANRRPLTPGITTLAVSMITAGFLVVPILIVVLISFSASRYLEFPPPAYSLRWYGNAITDHSWIGAFVLSLQVALSVSLLATTLGTLAAFGFMRSEFRGKAVLLAVALSPLVVPGIVVAVGSYFLFARLGLLETRIALVLSHTALALPVVLLSVMASLSGVDSSLDIAARSLGAGPFEAAWRITLPLISPGIVTGSLFAFITSFDEPIIALFIAGTRAVTLPKRMWDGIQYEIDPTSAAVATILVLIAASVVIIAGGLSRARPLDQ